MNLSIEAIKYLAGRIFVFYLYSFSFSEFLSAVDKPLYNILYNIFTEGDKLSEQINKKIYKYLLSYLVYGGYPRILLAKDDEEKFTESLRRSLNRKSYWSFFKTGKSVNEIASKYNILPKSVTTWKKQFFENASSAFEDSALRQA